LQKTYLFARSTHSIVKIKCCEVPVAIALLSLVTIIFVSSVLYNVATVSASDDNLKLWPRNATVGGLTLDEHSVVWWKILLETPLPSNPANDPDGRYCHNGETESTWYVYGNFGGVGPIRHCTIPAGKTIFGATLAFECSFDEYPQLKTLDELRSCTKQGADAISSYSVEIDGKPLNRSDIYRIMSGPFEFTWGNPNIYGLNLPVGKVGTSIQDGYFFALEPLPTGEHSIRITGSVLADPGSGNPGFALDQTYLLTVENPPTMISPSQNITMPFSNSSITMNVSS
jgi:hypothetical protein